MALLEVLCRALIFIIRIRFPPGKSLVTILKTQDSLKSRSKRRSFYSILTR